MCGFPHGDLDAFEPTYDDKLNGGDGPLKRDEVGREGIEPSWVAPGDFKSPASTVSPVEPSEAILPVIGQGDYT
jgi:hypothetical protein